jgi:DMATS type aromatic prenyltransferase
VSEAPHSPALSFAEVIEGKTDTLLGVLGIAEGKSAEFRRGLQSLIDGWGHQAVGSILQGCYFASNDGAPFEFSFAWTESGTEIRFGCEAATDHDSALRRQEAGADLTRRLAINAGVAIDRYLAVEDLFVTPVAPAPFSIGHVIAWRPDKEPTYKVYLNPSANGRERASATVLEAVERLGMADAWRSATDLISRQGKPGDLAVFALDLTRSQDARVKIYLTLPAFAAAELEAMGQLSPLHRPGKITEALEIVYNGRYTMDRKPCMLCLSFTSAIDTLASMNFYLPLDPNIPSDAEALPAVSSLMRHEGIDPTGYQRLVRALLPGGLKRSHMQSWVSCKAAGSPGVTVYIGPELYRNGHETSGRG